MHILRSYAENTQHRGKIFQQSQTSSLTHSSYLATHASLTLPFALLPVAPSSSQALISLPRFPSSHGCVPHHPPEQPALPTKAAAERFPCAEFRGRNSGKERGGGLRLTQVLARFSLPTFLGSLSTKGRLLQDSNGMHV